MNPLDSAIEKNPCELYRELDDAYIKLIKGDHAVKIRYTSGGGQTQETEFQKADLESLKRERARAHEACLKHCGQQQRPARYALAAGGKIRRQR